MTFAYVALCFLCLGIGLVLGALIGTSVARAQALAENRAIVTDWLVKVGRMNAEADNLLGQAARLLATVKTAKFSEHTGGEN